MKEKKAAISIMNLSKSYGKKRGVTNLTLEVEQGDIFGFLGPNVLRYEQKTGSLFRYL